jgi:predicted  nucleic acid-binding Zn-ribbon protein
MATWTEILLNTLKLTDEVQKLNGLTEKLSDKTIDLDKRLVRLETLVEVAKYQSQPPSIGQD